MDALSTDRSELVQKVADSHSFARAPRLRELFLYIAEQALAGHLEELSEQQIGIRVFGRPEAYNPAEDNIVRVSARQLRMKLKEYFETEGRDLNMTIDIPKGGYLPVFEMRSVISELVPIIPTAVGESTPVGGGRQRGLWLAVVALGGICLVLLALLLRPKAAVPGDPKGIWTEMFGTSNGRIMFVLTDSALMVTSPLMKGPPGLEQYVSGDYLQEVEKQLDSATAKEIGRNLRPRRITSIADVMILTRLVQSHPELARRIEVRHAKDMHARDFSNGSFIMTGGPRSNPWASLFESGLNFHFSGGSVINENPRPNESAVYGPFSKERQWSRIFFGRNIGGAQAVVLIAGLEYEGTEGGGDFLLRPTALQEIRAILGLGERQPLPSFELLLETTTLGGTARATKIAAARSH